MTNRLESGNLIRAAQYLRMSSDVQRYSTENQQNAIAEYAHQHGYKIVASYRDAGKSGLSLKGREALRQLLSDALSAQRPFDAILVLDVSRWGRFQNPDQAGHYEFLCRQAGVPVIYCGEPFDNDVVPATTIVKHLKRVMAGEYSRELSAKVCRAHRQQALLGFRQGGSLTYGFRRLLVDASRNPRQILNAGQRKALSSDKVVIVPGPPEELAVIRRIFRLFVQQQLSVAEIARRLSRTGIPGYGGKPLGHQAVRHILSCELCIGRMTYNVTTTKLQGPTKRNPEELWARFAAFEPVVPIKQFRRAQQRLAQSQVRWNKQSIANSLRALLAEKGRLTQVLINEYQNGPCHETVVNHFGSLDAAYAAIGYLPEFKRKFGMNGKFWGEKALFAGLKKIHAANGFVSNRLIDTCADLPSSAFVRRRFGTLSEAIRRAGLPVVSHSETQKRAWKQRKAAGSDEIYQGVRWTKEELARALRKLHKTVGYLTANVINQNEAAPSADYYCKRFGSLDNARRFAGLPVLTHSQRMLAACKRKRDGKATIGRRPRHPDQRIQLHYRSNDILTGLQILVRKKGVISALLINADPALPSAECVINHFGSLREAYRLAGIVPLKGKLVRFGLPPPKTMLEERS
ncbi:recombinase family protein [Bradyrhizobium sp. DASA03076]|uniref:recombinase family protein n=1 Tax=Bradyrhizobium sp. BLXBL-03 TaxID=3395916 RepID=UPI003F71EE84